MLGEGAASTGSLEERQAFTSYVWATRGRDLGALAREYCLTANQPQRKIMRDSAVQHAGTARVVILCMDGPPP